MLHSARAQAVISRIFSDGDELKAIGAAKQLEGMFGLVPQGLLDLLKNNCAKPLQATQYELMRALEHETQSINKILRMQQQGVQLLWTLIVSSSIGFSNYFFPRILSANGDGFMVVVIGVIVALAAIGLSITRLARHRHATNDPGQCTALICSRCTPCAKRGNARDNKKAVSLTTTKATARPALETTSVV